MQRIYVGGLTPTVSEADVKGRFQPFGDVIACEIAKCKVGDPSLSRGFAYVSFVPKDQVALSRVFSLYNGCKWKGQILRVELAKPDFRVKLQQEWLEDQELEQQAASNSQDSAFKHLGVPATTGSDEDEAEASGTIRLQVPGPKRKSVVVDLTSKARSHRCWFPAHKEKRLADLDWEPLPPSKRVAMQAAAAAAVVATEMCRAQESRHEKQQQIEVTPQLHQGAAVAFTYPQQQQQQQQQPMSKGKQQLEQEHYSQLKLLKRIAHREQQHQQQYEDSRPSSAAATTAARQAAPGQQTSWQMMQQQTPLLGVVMFSDDEEEQDAAAAEAPTAADLLQQLSRFDDSDAEDEGPAALSLPSNGIPAKQGQLQKAPGQPPALQPGLVNGKHEQQQQQQRQEDSEKKHQKQLNQYNQLQPQNTAKDDDSSGGSPSSSSSSRDEPHLAGGGQQWGSGSAQHSAQGQEADGGGAQALKAPAPAPKTPKQQQQQQQAQQRPQQSELPRQQQQAPNDAQSELPQRHKQQPQQHNQQQRPAGPVLDLQMQQPGLQAASVAVVDFLEGEQPLVIRTEELDRFGDDSEEVLQDVDSEEEDSQAREPIAVSKQAAGKQPDKRRSRQSGDTLLCPLVAAKAAGSDHKATTAKRQRIEQQTAAARSKRA